MTNISDKTILYNQLYKNFIDMDKKKINEIKLQMNTHICNSSSYISKYNLPIYLDYILDTLCKSFPQLNKNLPDIIKLLDYIDKINIHPLIFQSLIINIIHSSYINEIIIIKNSTTDLTNNFDHSILINISTDVSMLFSQFDKIFNDIDKKYLIEELNIGYNNMSSYDEKKFNDIFNNIAINQYNNQNQNIDYKLILNSFIIYIERVTQINIENYIKTINVDVDDILTLNETILGLELDLDSDLESDLKLNISNKFNYKFTFDNNLLNKLTKVYNNFLKNNYIQIKFFDIFEDINILNNIDELNKNILYFWIDYIAIINNSLFEKLLK
jgi:hypothetical protein